MPLTIPVRNLKDTSKICQTVRESDSPIIFTRNGYSEMVLVKPSGIDGCEGVVRIYHVLHISEDWQEDI